MAITGDAVRAILFALFGALTAVLSEIIAPTYDHLLVPELAPGALYPSLTASGGTGFLGLAASFSTATLTDLVDPAVALVGLTLAGLYLLRAVFAAWKPRLEALLPKLVIAVLVANLTVPIAGAVLALAGATYPVFAGWDGGAWELWTNIAGMGMFQYSWDNGAVAVVLSFLLFSIILLLALAIAVRNALLGVLLVLLPIFTLLWPIPYLNSLARRGWLWFVELAFLPCAMVVPLELAVGSPSILLTMGYLVIALAAPAIVSVAGASLTQVGFPAAGGTIASGLQRGLAVASVAVQGFVQPMLPALKAAGAPARLTASIERAAGQPVALALPAFTGEMLGHGTARLFEHMARHGGRGGPSSGATAGAGSGRWSAPPVRRGSS